MKTAVYSADWAPKPGFPPRPRDFDGKLTHLGSQAWGNLKLSVEAKECPQIGANECLIEVKVRGI